MSSHHVVRDEQEPAVIIASPPGNAFPQLSEMFEWSPVVIVLETALADFLQWDTKLDILIGSQQNNLKYQDELSYQQPYKFLESQPNPVEQALLYLAENKHNTAHIFTKTPDFKISQNTELNNMEIVFFDGEMKIVQSKAKFFSKWVAQNTCFKIFNGKVRTFENINQQNDLLIASQNGFINIFGETEFWIGEKLKN